jgi:exopolysaccharide production protein ExoQ
MKEPANTLDRGFPQIPDALAIFYVALTIIIMAYSFLFKVFPILIFLGMWFAHIFYKRTFILRLTRDLFFAITIPFLCCYSALWSDFPRASFYAGAGYVAMVACVVVIARTVSTKAYIKGMTLGCMVTLIASLMNARDVKDEFSSSVSHIGLFGSKNEAGFFAEIGIIASLLILSSKMNFREKFVFGLLPLFVTLYALYESKSASSDISLILALAAAAGAWFLHKLSPLARAVTVCMGILGLITIGTLVSATNANVFDPVLKVFGKDTTLTGRTYLWSEGIRNGLKHPTLGYGYFAFWQPGRPEAEHYWSKFDIPGKSGFHFHNLFVQSFVDLGFVGLGLIVLFILCGLYKSLKAVIKNGLEPEAGLALGISAMFLIRSFVEVDLFGPFGLGPLIYFAIIPRLAREKTARERSLESGV